jgi:gamma-glutamyltranspeptidase/glutathione hydrolase
VAAVSEAIPFDAAAATLEAENGGRPAVQIWGTRGMVVAMHPVAAQVALDVLRAGGNAFDAGIALSAALAVVSPDWAGVAGDCAWLLHDAASAEFHHLDGYSTCPQQMTPASLAAHFELDARRLPRAFLEEPPAQRATGFATSMIPGTPASWDALGRKLCTLPIRELLSPAVRLAKFGFVVNRYLAESFRLSEAKLRAHASSKDEFCGNEGALPKEGSVLVQKDLGETLEELAECGIDSFYRGAIAERIVAYAKDHGGFMSMADFSEFRAVWRGVHVGRYRGVDVVVTGAPTAGLHLLQALAILERFDLRAMGYHSPGSLHCLIETTKRALAERRAFAGDPEHLMQDPDQLLAPSRIDMLCSSIPSGAATSISDLQSLGASTTHFLVCDAAGNLVSATQSLGSRFGCGDIVAGTGLIMNDRSWWMSLGDGPNVVAPGRRASIGHCPAILCEEGMPKAALGSPGGFGILQYMAQTIVNMRDYGFDVQDAIEAPRFRLEGLGRRVWVERRIEHKTLAALERMGHQVVEYPGWTDRMGGVEGLEIDQRTGVILGGCDARRNSMALGLN